MKLKKFENLVDVPLRRGVSHRVFSGDGATLAWRTLEVGHETNPHAHPHEQIVYIVSGRIRFTVGDEVALVELGDMFVIPPDVVHWAENVGDDTAVDLSVFSPRRAEYAAEEES